MVSHSDSSEPCLKKSTSPEVVVIDAGAFLAERAFALASRRELQRCFLISRHRRWAVSPLPSDSWSPHIVARVCAKRVVPVTARRPRGGELLPARATLARNIDLAFARSCSSCSSMFAAQSSFESLQPSTAPARPRPHLRATARPGSEASALRARVPVRGNCRGRAGPRGGEVRPARGELGDIPPVGPPFRVEPTFQGPDPKAETGRRFVVRRAPVVSCPPTIVRGCSLPPHSQWPGSKQC